MSEENKSLEEKMNEWLEKGKKSEEITQGMFCDGFQSISGIPDDFCSAEDPEDRARLLEERRPRTYESDNDGYYRGYGDFRYQLQIKNLQHS